MNMVAKTMALVFGVLLILVGLAGFIPNPVIGSEGSLEIDTIGNAMHLVFGAILLFNTRKGESTAAMGLYLVAGFSFLMAAVGYKEVGSYGKAMLFGTVVVTPALNYFHAGLATVLVISGLMNTSSRQLLRD